MSKKSIGLDVKAPEQSCDDDNCPFHGSLSVRGQIIEGIVVSDKMSRTVIVERERLHYLSKFERYEKRTGRYKAHNPDCIEAKVGDHVKIVECRPLSKVKSFVVVEKT
jgi:small subunit ribosomal protein S17